MRLDLTKEDLITLVNGVYPHYSVMDLPGIRKHGQMYEPYGWKWNKYSLEELVEEELFDIYQVCKTSWK